MSNEIIPSNRGFGTWRIEIYTPARTVFEDIKGFLIISKDHCAIFEDSDLKITLLDIPSQNIAWIQRVSE